MTENVLDTREVVMMNKLLLNPTKEIVELAQKKTLSGTVCKAKWMCYKVVINSGSIDNMVYKEMVENFGLKRIKHPTL